ncbi:MAG: dTDP-4-dehydrorhamnose reductase [Spirochaetaceae bacterium]|nr:dTDP-4-dehydrorhamnose reductase [Spirochaetaceae bacterium]
MSRASTKIWLTGANGLLAKALKTELSDYPLLTTTHKELDICHINKSKNFITNNKINIIINCAAFTQVDKAEQQPQSAYAINSYAVKNLASLMAQQGGKIIHFSTDYLFDGLKEQPYNETDRPKPLNIYGHSKLLGERYLHKICPNSVTIRTSWLYGDGGNSFVHKILKQLDKPQINVVANQLGSPTYANSLAKVIPYLLESNLSGIFHYSAFGTTSWYNYACEIMKLTSPNQLYKLTPINGRQLTQAKRPFCSVLDKKKILKTLPIKINDWQSELTAFLKAAKLYP